MNSQPLVSVVIPTTGTRPRYLHRAIASALSGMPAGSVEVLVVQNGHAAHGPLELGEFDSDPNVRRQQVTQGQANVARNAGLKASLGEFVRFLDDDDFLESSGAQAQYLAMQTNSTDACTGVVRFVDEGGDEFDRYTPLPGDDLVVELFLQRPSTIPVAHVFRRAFLDGMEWDTARAYLQDVDWMHGLIRRGEVRWASLHEVVGAWSHHGNARVSVDYARRSRHAALKLAAGIIETSVDALNATNRLDGARRAAAAKALWDYAHQGFRYSPVHWHPIAAKARRLSPGSRPANHYLNSGLMRHCNPLWVEWLMFPLRAVTRGFVE